MLGKFVAELMVKKKKSQMEKKNLKSAEKKALYMALLAFQNLSHTHINT